MFGPDQVDAESSVRAYADLHAQWDAVLSHEAQKHVSITFVPHLVPMTRGMLTTIYATPASALPPHQQVLDDRSRH